MTHRSHESQRWWLVGGSWAPLSHSPPSLLSISSDAVDAGLPSSLLRRWWKCAGETILCIPSLVSMRTLTTAVSEGSRQSSFPLCIILIILSIYVSFL